MRILFSVTLTVLLGVLAPLTVAAAGFRDVPSSHPNYDAILYVQEQGIVEGYSDGTYKPDQTIMDHERRGRGRAD